ncbi:MAG: DUF86 domain-containing protein [Chloroflexi bacterium]|nr:DUF86 domain-containing protein [Chloroflexota bacterium]
MSKTVEFRLPLEAIRAYCRQRPIKRLLLFGSALREDFTQESDIDLLVEYAPEADLDAYEIFRQQEDFSEIIGRPVDLGEPHSLKPYIRQEVIESAELIYDVNGIEPGRSKPMPKKPDRDRLRLLDMRDAAEDAISIAGGYSRAEIEKIRMLQLALVKAVEIIGEAANHVSEDTRALAPDIDWGDIVGMRNNLVHAYWKINYDALWDVITYQLPPLISELHRLIEAKYGAQDE